MLSFCFLDHWFLGDDRLSQKVDSWMTICKYTKFVWLCKSKGFIIFLWECRKCTISVINESQNPRPHSLCHNDEGKYFIQDMCASEYFCCFCGQHGLHMLQHYCNTLVTFSSYQWTSNEAKSKCRTWKSEIICHLFDLQCGKVDGKYRIYGRAYNDMYIGSDIVTIHIGW